MKSILVLVISVAMGWAMPVLAADVRTMEVQELNERLGAEDLVVLDVRTAGDWQTSDRKIRGAVREDPRAVASWTDRYDKRRTIVLYCS